MEILWILMLIVCAGLWGVYRRMRNFHREDERQWRKASILSEAEGTIMDFLDYGREVAQATKGTYRGTISVRMQRVNQKGDMGFFISMYDSGDLRQLREPVLDQLHLTGFVKNYGAYYDPERDAVVYQTHRGLRLRPGEKEEMTRELLQRIQNHPMAMIKSDSVITTRGI